MPGYGATWALLALAVCPAVAQFSSWEDKQIGTSICVWMQPRAAIIRDMIYLDGGNIYWTPHMSDGTLGGAIDNGNNAGIVLNYNLSTPFDKDTNVTGILVNKAMSKARGGSGNSNGAAPNFLDGGLLYNDAQFYLYGGDLLKNDEVYEPPDADEVLTYQAYAYGPDKPLWDRGFNDRKLGDKVTRYIAYGGAANAPSENLAWYFSGLRSPSRGPFFTNDATAKATNVSNTLITLDMAEQLDEKWTNTTLPPSVKGRANPEVVWVPVGKKGILVVLGGVVYPEWAGRARKSANEEASEKESPVFMEEIDIYDIDGKKWYKQETKDGPGALTRGCAVVAPASDRSSFNIYWYGGYDGLHPMEPFNDAVWALSIPSFTWTQINKGTNLHARAGHKCFMPYPDQMMVFGGYTSQSGVALTCLDKGPVLNFNLTSGEWLESYDPADFSDYGVHEAIQSKIGGDAEGGATATAPADGWATSALGKVFDTEYDMKKIKTYWPYGKATATGRPTVPNNGTGDDDNDKSGGGGGGLPKWVAPVLGVVLGLMFVTGALVVFCIWRRRGIFKNRSSDYGTEDPGSRIRSWIRGTGQEKAVTVTTSDDIPTSPEMEEATTARAVGVGSTPSNAETPASPTSPRSPGSPLEMPDTQIHEMPDTSMPSELHDTGLSPLEVIQKHSHFAKGRQHSSPSSRTYSEHTSTFSRSTDQQGVSSPGSATPARSSRITSDVSGVSEGDAAQLRNLGATPVSPRSAHSQLRSPSPVGKADSDILPSPGEEPTPISPPGDPALVSPTPVSPPTAGESSGGDYLSAKSSASPLRKSMFVESEEDMGKQK
ncbi:hypothetical protein LCI18_007763 [Fusarium solani-melongenae]|uniref:Uncharacterized protein n=1 Tax=Fusarium solani subsp. cucurbitae TaxID=2747967 RepID=A0ACD3Z9S4_FUSSC|nr:hypothetical protein LCI18_007763 [Fusarium solani-melongenae]